MATPTKSATKKAADHEKTLAEPFPVLVAADGREIELKPLKISGLRRFMRRFNDLTKLEEPDGVEMLDILTDCAAICLRSELPNETAYVAAAQWDKVTDEDRDPFGELFDMDDINKINEACGGVSFGGPNLQTETPVAEAPDEN